MSSCANGPTPDARSASRWVTPTTPMSSSADGKSSLYRADDQMLVNAHVWGVLAYGAPAWHLRRHGDGGKFDTYAGSFDAVWETAHPVEG